MTNINNKLLKRFFISFALLLLATAIFAQIPSGYYDSANGVKGGATLKTAFYQIIKNPDVVSYAELWRAFPKTDKRPDNGKVWDMYSDIPNGTPPYLYAFGTNQCSNYRQEGDCYNREHSFPASWFGKIAPMYNDLFQIYPTDGYVNNRRSNYPFGEVGIASWTSKNGSKVGQNTFGNYTATVFEPIDEYKGDFARTYFYMVTAYENRVANWKSAQLANNTYPAFSTWSKELLLKWHRMDPVSNKEIARNNAIYSIQKNRNPFIDFPKLAEYIWGNKTNEVFYISNSTNSKKASSTYKMGVYSKPAPHKLQATIFSEDFDGFMGGAPNNGASSLNVANKLDNFTEIGGWQGYNIFQAGRSVKIGSGSKLGNITTPVIDLSSNRGNFFLRFEVMAWKNDARNLKIFLDNRLVYTVTDLNNDASYTFKSYTIPLSGGTATSTIRFEGERANRGRFFLNNLQILHL